MNHLVYTLQPIKCISGDCETSSQVLLFYKGAHSSCIALSHLGSNKASLTEQSSSSLRQLGGMSSLLFDLVIIEWTEQGKGLGFGWEADGGGTGTKLRDCWDVKEDCFCWQGEEPGSCAIEEQGDEKDWIYVIGKLETECWWIGDVWNKILKRNWDSLKMTHLEI